VDWRIGKGMDDISLKNTDADEKNMEEAYEREHLKNAELASRIAELEFKNEELEFKLNRIKNNPLWKASRPARDCMHWAIRQKQRLSNCGGARGVLLKLNYKKREREAM
jgi:predicted RNase H-like nuclease (RuvC/YqgF family)